MDLSNTPTTAEQIAPGYYFDMPENQYRDAEGVNKSYFFELSKRTGYHLRYGNGSNFPQATADRGIGSHACFLEGRDIVEMSGFKTRAGAAFKQAHEEAKARGKILMPYPEFEDYEGMIAAAKGDWRFQNIMNRPGVNVEVSMFALDPVRDIRWKGRADVVNLKEGKMYDFKTCADASPDGFMEAVFKYGYDKQAAFYVMIMRELGVEITQFNFMCVETKAPYATNLFVMKADGEVMRAAEIEVNEMLDAARDDIFCESPTTGWPTFTEITLPTGKTPSKNLWT